jgi:small subunit ribosomal protein S9
MSAEGRYYYGLGRRKTASAQVRLYPTGEGELVVNGRPVQQYFTRRRDLAAVTAPLNAAGLAGYTVSAQVSGGGVGGQAGAVMQGVARALVSLNADLRGSLRRGGYLTRDPRMKERKKPGLKRARKAPQYTKR